MKPRIKQFNSVWMVGAVAMASVGLTSSNAEACGGFFCNNQDPTIQTGENILFSVDDDNIRAYVQVFYDGPADDFAWIIPVASNPDVGVGTDAVFTQLGILTRPSFQVKEEIDDSCWEVDGLMNQMIDEEALFAGDEGGGSEGGEGGGGEYVNVLAEGDAGPYNYVTLESNNSDILVAWLNENDYAQPPSALPLIEHYVANEMLFVAVKLQPGKDVGDIAPIVLDFKEQNPCVPLVLTSVAASTDMPVRVYLLGKERAIPTNWLHVTINEKKLDWWSLQNTWWGGGNLESYENTLLEAIAEADGHAFTTEFAGSSDLLKKAITTSQYNNVDELLEYTNAMDFMGGIQDFFSGNTQLLNILRIHMPAPDGVSEQDFYNSPWSYEEQYTALNVDLDALYTALIDVIVTPMIEAEEMFKSQPYLTSLYTKVAIENMDRDPIFEFQKGEDISNVHKATFKMTCDNGAVSYYMELENGDTFVPETPNWVNLPENSVTPDDVSELPGAERIELFGHNMEPRIVPSEYAEYVDDQLDMTPSENVDIPESTVALTLGDSSRAATGQGCSATGSESGSTHLAMVLLVMGLVVLRRREISQG